MSIDAILSQVTGGLNWSSLSWEILLRAMLILLAGIIFNKLLLRTVDRLLLRSASLAPIQRYLRSALSVLLWLVLILVVLGSVGVEMTSIIALLSVAGLAVSLALQNTLSNLAGGITLLASKPFTVGDYVEIGSVSGTVSLVGLAYTTLVTVENKEIYIPNSQLSSATIINYTRLGRPEDGDHRLRLLRRPHGGGEGRPGRGCRPVSPDPPRPCAGDPPVGLWRQRNRLSPAGLDLLRGLLGRVLPPAGGHPPRLRPPTAWRCRTVSWTST